MNQQWIGDELWRDGEVIASVAALGFLWSAHDADEGCVGVFRSKDDAKAAADRWIAEVRA